MDTCIHLGTDTGDECAWFSIYKRYKDETEEKIEQLKEDIEKARNQIDFQQEVYREQIDEIDALKAERDALLPEIEKLSADRAAIRLERDALKAVNELLRELIERMGIHSDNKETCALCAGTPIVNFPGGLHGWQH